jgi:hypothetical protein
MNAIFIIGKSTDQTFYNANDFRKIRRHFPEMGKIPQILLSNIFMGDTAILKYSWGLGMFRWVTTEIHFSCYAKFCRRLTHPTGLTSLK